MFVSQTVIERAFPAWVEREPDCGNCHRRITFACSLPARSPERLQFFTGILPEFEATKRVKTSKSRIGFFLRWSAGSIRLIPNLCPDGIRKSVRGNSGKTLRLSIPKSSTRTKKPEILYTPRPSGTPHRFLRLKQQTKIENYAPNSAIPCPAPRA